MKERPILFSGAMVRALLDGSKTQTRRVCKPAQAAALSYVIGIQDPRDFGQRPLEITGSGWFGDEEGDFQFACPYGKPGERLWVRETHLNWWNLSDPGKERTFSHVAAYAADGYQLEPGEKWIPSIHMLRAASRILLEIVSVRVERLQDISDVDARAEGVLWDAMGWTDYAHNDGRRKSSSRQSYETLWESINGAGSWAANPYVWVVEFKRVLP